MFMWWWRSCTWITIFNIKYIWISSELNKDINAFIQCAYVSHHADKFEWTQGSALFFWWWHRCYKSYTKDGVPQWTKGKPSETRRPQPKIPDPNTLQRVRENINKVRDRYFIAPGLVQSLISYFAVPKGESDIRMVNDGTLSGFNDWVWAEEYGISRALSIEEQLLAPKT